MKRRRKVNSNVTPFIVPCPAHIRKRMLKNLTRALHDRISPSRRKRAEEIFSYIKKQERKQIPSPSSQIGSRAKSTLKVTERTKDIRSVQGIGNKTIPAKRFSKCAGMFIKFGQSLYFGIRRLVHWLSCKGQTLQTANRSCR